MQVFHMKLENKVALVDGADTGIGNEIAKLFAKEGASVVLVARKKEKLEGLLNQINAHVFLRNNKFQVYHRQFQPPMDH